jgi:acyl-CoA reductase-like NAD-dependent aldehyde dehydrogenase
MYRRSSTTPPGRGAKLLTGDGAIEGQNGTLTRQVVFTDVTTDMYIYASEIFGPATVIHTVDSIEAVINLANDTEYGLTGGVISRDLSAALDVVSRVRSGIIHINDQGIADEPMAPGLAQRVDALPESSARSLNVRHGIMSACLDPVSRRSRWSTR